MSQRKTIAKVDVVRHGESIVVPMSVKLEDAIEVLTRQLKYENEFVVQREVIDAAPWDGAYALMQAIERRLGFVFQKPTPGFFGDSPPVLNSVAVGPREKIQVPWGQFRMPGTDHPNNIVETEVEEGEDGRLKFVASFHIQHKYEHLAKEIADLARKIVREESIYRGKAMRLRFKDERGRTLHMPQPSFLDLDSMDFSQLVYPRDLERRIDVELLTPVRLPKQARALGVPAKRGILLAGPYGTGKTLLASKVAAEATANGWTYLYVQNVQELADAIRWSAPYDPVVIFAEDLDRVVAGTERTVEIDTVLNTIDGIDSKSRELMVVLTTNHLEKVHDAMLRPGRLDVILPIMPPDADAVARLIHTYGRGLVDNEADLAEVGRMLAGQIPAVIREVVERSKLAALYRTGRVENLIVTGEDLLVAAQTVKAQRDLLKPKEADPTAAELLGRGIGTAIGAHLPLRDVSSIQMGGQDFLMLEAGTKQQQPNGHASTDA